jgi:glycosyltransferase involved in cell wall biosynthesis
MVQKYLPRALESVLRQNRPVDAISVCVDKDHLGAAECRTRALTAVRTEWTALLDSDDEWLPDHVGALLEHAQATGADLVYPWFTIPEHPGGDPWPEREGEPFDRELLRSVNYVPITVLVRTELLLDVGGFHAKGPADNPCDDWGTWERLLDAGARFEHRNQRTWLWHWHGANTSGRRDRW